MNDARPQECPSSGGDQDFAARRALQFILFIGVLMGIEIRLFLVIDAFSRFSGTPIACSSGLFLQLAKQLLDSTATASGRGLASVDAGVTAGPWRRLEKAPLTTRTTRFLVPANTGRSASSPTSRTRVRAAFWGPTLARSGPMRPSSASSPAWEISRATACGCFPVHWPTSRAGSGPS